MSDTEKRKQYDNFGIDFFKNGGNSNMNVDPMNIFEQDLNMGGFPGRFSYERKKVRFGYRAGCDFRSNLQ